MQVSGAPQLPSAAEVQAILAARPALAHQAAQAAAAVSSNGDAAAASGAVSSGSTSGSVDTYL